MSIADSTNETVCLECGGPLVLAPFIHHETVGRYRVTDRSVSLAQCTACDERLLTSEQWSRYELRAALTIFVHASVVGGAELKYARKALGLRQSDFAAIIGFAEESNSRWDHEQRPLPQVVKVALQGLVAVRLMGEFEGVKFACRPQPKPLR